MLCRKNCRLLKEETEGTGERWEPEGVGKGSGGEGPMRTKDNDSCV